ncbi:MAG: site-specific integrase [Pirellulaceae bacterium]|nr:site-specific integrase [Pirellulaceae bacterium]
MGKKRIPRYPKKPHSSGQARIQLGGKRVYLGTFGSPESYEKFYREVAEYQASGGVPLPSPEPTSNKVTVAELILAHKKWAEQRYVKDGKPTSEVRSFKTALQPVFRLYGGTPVDDFGPRALLTCRQWLIDRGYIRRRINQHVGRIRAVWKWGVPRELTKAETLGALMTVPGLRKGEGGTRDNPPIGPVPDEHVAAVERFVTPPIWAMIQLQSWSACRPGEACAMRTCDVRDDDPLLPLAMRGMCWVYRPGSHKTEHHDKARVVLLGPKTQDMLRAWLRPGGPEAFLFSPREAREWWVQKQREAASKPDRRCRKKRNPKTRPGEIYTTSAYHGAIREACERAGVPSWAPNQLRHNAATLLRREYGAEVARIILGHSRLSTTEIYAERDISAAVQAMASFG